MGIAEGGLESPHTTTPWCTMSLPGSDSSQFPPLSAAMSTMTDPSAMRSTMGVVTSTGAWRPGTAAVVITTSAAATSLLISSRWRARNSSDCTRA